MRILLLRQWFDPEPTFRGLHFARALMRRGHSVQVLTGFPNYPEGKLYAGYRMRPWQRETMDGIPILRVPLYPSHDRSAARRIANYATFGASASLLGPLLVERPDVTYVHNMVTLHMAATVFRTLHRSAVLFDVADLWPDSVAASGMLKSGRALDLLGRWCNHVYSRSDHVVVPSPGIHAELCRRGLSSENVTTIYNWCDEETLTPCARDLELRRSIGFGDGFVLMYAGNMGIMQGLDTILDAALALRDSCPDVRVALVGGGVEAERLQSTARDRGLHNVVFVPRQPMGAMGRILALADVLLVHLRDTPLFRITIPSKTQAYLATGVPVLMAVSGDAADLVERSGGGLTCPPDDAPALAQAVLRFRDMSARHRQNMGKAGRAFYQHELSLDAGVMRFEHCMEQALEKRRHVLR